MEEQAGRPASLALNSAKRLRHAVLHSAGHAVDKAVVGAVGAGVFAPLKGYHFDDSPYVEYRGTLPSGLEKDAFIEKVTYYTRLRVVVKRSVLGLGIYFAATV